MGLIAKLFGKDNSLKPKRSYCSDELFFRFNELAEKYSQRGVLARAKDNTQPSIVDDYSLNFIFYGKLNDGREYTLSLDRKSENKSETDLMEVLLDRGRSRLSYQILPWNFLNFFLIPLKICTYGGGLKAYRHAMKASKEVIRDIKQKVPYLFETAYKPEIKGRGQSLDQMLPFIK